jgi:hypothetical protein
LEPGSQGWLSGFFCLYEKIHGNMEHVLYAV